MAEIIHPHEKCATCGHGFSFHQKAFDKPCGAMGCRGGHDGERCAAFVRDEKTTRLSAAT